MEVTEEQMQRIEESEPAFPAVNEQTKLMIAILIFGVVAGFVAGYLIGGFMVTSQWQQYISSLPVNTNPTPFKYGLG